jgi:cephalosporin-C deacetylase
MVIKPDNFDEYWNKVAAELSGIDVRPELEELHLHSNEHCTVYWVKLTSIGPCRIGGYLSVPKGTGPFPAIFQTPRYNSINQIADYNDRKRYVVLTLMHRGQRRTHQPWAAPYPGLLTDGIADPSSYVYRSIVADCLRGAEFLLEHLEVDRDRTLIMGDDLALITAARRNRFSYVHAAGLVFHRLMEQRNHTSAYPIEEVNDYLRSFPSEAEQVESTVSYFDPVHHAQNVTATTLLSVGKDGAVGGREWLSDLRTALAGDVEEYRVTLKGGTDNDSIDAWIAGKLGTEAMSRFRRQTT